MTVRVLGLDPSFRAFGWSVVELLPDSERVVAMGVIRTEKSDKKRGIRVADDDYRCALELGIGLAPLVNRLDVRAVCAEGKQGSKSVKGAACMAYAWGVLAGVMSSKFLPLMQVSPQEVKKAVCGIKTASKSDVAACVVRHFEHRDGGQDAIDRFLLETSKSTRQREHAFDALATVVACLDSEVIRAIRPRAAQAYGMLTRGGVS